MGNEVGIHSDYMQRNGLEIESVDSRVHQLTLWKDHVSAEDPDYLSNQIITYIGNKRALLGQIGSAVGLVQNRLGKKKLRIFDAFSGSGIVSRFFKGYASFLVCNDIEDYAAVASRCYLRNKSTVDFSTLSRIVNDLNRKASLEPIRPGFIEDMYAPVDETRITQDDRVFYTRSNARRLDNYRQQIAGLPGSLTDMLLGPLISAASIHANTAGVFKGFYKNRHTKVGQFGGSGRDALERIMGEIRLEPPVLSNFECDYEVFKENADVVGNQVKNIDLAYFDPPYNQHPYGSNYFMLNLLVTYKRPTEVSRVSGIPTDWRRSDYNVRSKSLPIFKDLLTRVDSKFLLISFNNEGFIQPDEMRKMLGGLGSVEVFEKQYNAFRGSRSFNNRSIHVTEQLFLVERS